jgi:hypothetical protein
MLQHLKPDEAAIEKLALAETDRRQHARFAPLRWGFAGNLLVLALAGGLGLAHALLATLWRKLFFPSRHDSR